MSMEDDAIVPPPAPPEPGLVDDWGDDEPQVVPSITNTLYKAAAEKCLGDDMYLLQSPYDGIEGTFDSFEKLSESLARYNSLDKYKVIHVKVVRICTIKRTVEPQFELTDKGND